MSYYERDTQGKYLGISFLQGRIDFITYMSNSLKYQAFLIQYPAKVSYLPQEVVY